MGRQGVAAAIGWAGAGALEGGDFNANRGRGQIPFAPAGQKSGQIRESTLKLAWNLQIYP